MTPQERDLITRLLDRVKQADTADKDPEADALIRGGLREKPDAPYVLVQTVLIQDMALNDAERRIAELERQIAETKAAQPQKSTSFLGGVLNRGAGAAGSVPASGPWSRPASPQQGPAGAWGQPPAPSPGYAQPGYGQPGPAPMTGTPMMGQSGGFLRSAAATAAGIAGGALLFQGIQSMFGGHAGLGSMAATPSISETVINNNYGTEPGAGAPDGMQHAAWTPAGNDALPGGDAPDPGLQYAADEGGTYDTDTDTASNDDFGGDDSDLV